MEKVHQKEIELFESLVAMGVYWDFLFSYPKYKFAFFYSVDVTLTVQ